MTDRELLELAAKAAGIDGEFVLDEAYAQERWHFMRPYDNQNMMTAYEWNPLTDDGDALRLAVKLHIEPHFVINKFVRGVVLQGSDLGEWESELSEVLLGNDQYAATRRAIVMAAAELAKGMK